jgi:hypothetical protein
MHFGFGVISRFLIMASGIQTLLGLSSRNSNTVQLKWPYLQGVSMKLRATLPTFILLLTAMALPVHAQDRTTGTTPVQSGLGHIQNPVQAMTTTPVRGFTSPPVTGMGVAVFGQNSGSTIPAQPQPQPQHRGGRKGEAIFVGSPGGAVVVPVGSIAEGDPNQAPGVFLSTPGLPTVTLNPEISMEPSGSSQDTGTAMNSAGLPTVTLNPEIAVEPRDANQDLGTSLTTPELPTVSLNTAVSVSSSGNTDVNLLQLGMAQQKVIERFGNPIAYVMNRNGQTLYFKSGMAVFIKDGVVSVPGK